MRSLPSLPAGPAAGEEEEDEEEEEQRKSRRCSFFLRFRSSLRLSTSRAGGRCREREYLIQYGIWILLLHLPPARGPPPPSSPPLFGNLILCFSGFFHANVMFLLIHFFFLFRYLLSLRFISCHTHSAPAILL